VLPRVLIGSPGTDWLPGRNLASTKSVKSAEDEFVRTYAQAAEILAVSRERVCQVTSLVTKLPPEIKDFLAGTKDPDILRFFTERRLRPLTMLSDPEAQMAQFAELLAEAKGDLKSSLHAV
jgi:transposase